MRLAVAGFMHESNTFNPMRADRAAFAAQAFHLGEGWVPEWRDAHHEIGGFLEGAARHGAQMLPLAMAWAVPSGPVTKSVFDEVTGYLVDQLKKQKPDGLLLGLHGAMVSEEHLDADGETVSRLREALGPDIPIVVTLDLHGNISERLIERSSAAISYRTNPHMDQRARGLEAVDLMVRTLKGEVRPTQAIARPPVIVNIMVQNTSGGPLKIMLDEARRLEKQPGILSVSLLPGFPYADVPQMGPSLIVVADGQPDLARHEADRLGAMLYDMRAELTRPLPEAPAAVAQALKEDRRPVVLVETGDNVGGGSAGDSTIVLGEILKQSGTDSVTCLFAPEEVRQCEQAGAGATLNLRVGGKVDRPHGDPLDVRGKVLLLHDGVYVEEQPRHGGRRTNNMGKTALVELPGRNLLVLNSERHPPFSLGQITCLGIKPAQMRLLVVKAAIAYRAAYAPVAGTIIEVDTPGTTAVNPKRFAYKHIRKMYPLA